MVTKLVVQPINMKVPTYKTNSPFRQYRATIVTQREENKQGDYRVTDKWCVIEAYPDKLKHYLHKRIIDAIGKCRLK